MPSLIRKIYQRGLHLLLIAFLPATLSSCLEEPEVLYTTPSQLFRPITFSASVNVVDVNFSWAPIKNASYLLELSRDEFNSDIVSIPIDGRASYQVTDLASQTRYTARIKAVSKETGVKDSEYASVTFTTGTENIFFQPAAADITSTSVLISWEPGKAVTHLAVSSEGETVRTISIPQPAIESGQLLVDQLSSETSYTFRIFKDSNVRGTITVDTLPTPEISE